MRFFHHFSAFLSLCVLITPLRAADWPQWRGPARDDISTETGLLKNWPECGPALAWKATSLGTGISGVSVAAGRVFTMGDGADSSFIHALDASTGKLLWSATVGAVSGTNMFPGPRCTPTVDGDLVYALGQFGDLVCVEAATGKERWRKSSEKDFPGSKRPMFAYSESPLVDGEKVIFTPGGEGGCIAALNKKTGDVIWRSTELPDNAAYSSIVIATIGGVRQYVQMTESSVAGISAEEGRLLWRAERPPKNCAINTPIVDGNLVYISVSYNIGCNLWRVNADDGKFSVEEVYANKEMLNHHGGVIKFRENVYGYSDSKGWVCQDFKIGEARWVEKEKLGKGSIACADGMFYLRLENGKGTLVLLQPDPTGWVEKGRFDQPDRSQKSSWPHPVISNGKMFIRDQDILLAYDVKGKQ